MYRERERDEHRKRNRLNQREWVLYTLATSTGEPSDFPQTSDNGRLREHHGQHIRTCRDCPRITYSQHTWIFQLCQISAFWLTFWMKRQKLVTVGRSRYKSTHSAPAKLAGSTLAVVPERGAVSMGSPTSKKLHSFTIQNGQVLSINSLHTFCIVQQPVRFN